MNIIYISSTRLPTEKARGVQIMKACEAFVRSGAKLRLIVPDVINPVPGDPFTFYGVPPIFTIERAMGLDTLSRTIARFSDTFAFYVRSVAFAIFSVLPLLGLRRKGHTFYSRDYPVLLLLALFGFKPVAEIHNFHSRRPRWHMRYIFENSKKIVVNAEGTRDEILKYYPIPPSKILVAQNGVDVEFFNVKESQEEARRHLLVPLHKTVISYVGRLETIGQEKGVGDLVEAFKLVHKNYPDSVLYIIGGPGDYVDKYRKQAGGYPDIVFTGQVEYRQIPYYLRAVDIVVIPFPDTQQYRTASPIKLFEFLAAGKAIVSSDIASLRVHLNGGNALFYRAGDASDLADKLQDILKQPDLMRQLSARALLDSKQHSWLNRADTIMKFIR